MHNSLLSKWRSGGVKFGGTQAPALRSRRREAATAHYNRNSIRICLKIKKYKIQNLKIFIDQGLLLQDFTVQTSFPQNNKKLVFITQKAYFIFYKKIIQIKLINF